MSNKGFTLLEVLISITILGTIAVIGFSYLGSYQRSVALKTETNKLVSSLRQAQNRAMTGQDLSPWGVHFINPEGNANDYYEIFQGSSYSSGTTTEMIYFEKSVGFNSPSDNSSSTVVFQRISGRTSSTTVSLISKSNSNLTQSININSLGQIDY